MNLHAIKPISFVKANASEVLNALSQSGQSMGITQHGEVKAVLVGAGEYKRTQETLAFLKLAALGDEDIRTGNTTPVEEFTAAMRGKLAGRKQ